MKNRNIIIICRDRDITVDIKKTSLRGFLLWGSHLKQKYLIKSLSNSASAKEIKTKIESNIMRPEWIANHRFGMFDLLNYVKNGYRYVHDPTINAQFFDLTGIPSATSIHIYHYLLNHNLNPINIDNFEGSQLRLKSILEKNPLAVVISATFLSAEKISRIIRFVRESNNDLPIIIGSGILLTKLDSNKQLEKEYEKIISENVYVILEEYGLDTLNVFLQRISMGKEFTDIPNIIYSNNRNIVYSERKYLSYDIDSNYPNWAKVDKSITKDTAFIRASQGCPYKCKFCSFPKASVKFRQRSVESVRDELRTIKSSNIKNVAFTDDHFAISPRRVREMCEMMLEEKFNFNWFAGIRASAINEDNAKLLEDTGCKVLCVGLESGDDRMLKLINKQTDTASNMKALEILDKHNIVAYGSFLLGFPGETDESIENTINWINRSPLKLYKIFLFSLLPDSVIYDEQVEHDITFFGDEYDYSLWKTPTMDALKASELLREFILRIEKAVLIYNYSPMYAFFPLLSRGYSMGESLEFFKIRTNLIKNELSNNSYFSKRSLRKEQFNELEELLRREPNSSAHGTAHPTY
ncbi:MAG: radical SAM protein [Deltaproteobacteria bacterium]|nr:radical SAM protein [Deltaproteobacteria bacterium]